MLSLVLPSLADALRLIQMLGYTIIALQMISFVRLYWSEQRDLRLMLAVGYGLVSIGVVVGGFQRWGGPFSYSMIFTVPGAIVGVAFVLLTIQRGGLKREDFQ